MSVTIALRKEDIGPWLLRFRERVSPRLLAKAAGGALYQTVVKHMDEDVSHRHATAARLGATPTKHWEHPEAYVHLKAGGDASEVSITRPGIARAVRDVTIRPRNAKALAIPISALSYGKRPAETEQELGRRLFRPKGTRVLVAARKDKKGKDTAWDVLYALSSAVFQKKDPTLLPSQSTLEKVLEGAALNAIETAAALAAKGM